MSTTDKADAMEELRAAVELRIDPVIIPLWTARALLAEAPVPALADMEARKDAAYLERNQVVAALASAYPSGIARTAIPGWSDDWHGVVYVDLPTGQASWHYHDSHAHLFAHLPPYTGKWDGHTTDEKYARLAALPFPSPAVRDAPLREDVIEQCARIADGYAKSAETLVVSEARYGAHSAAIGIAGKIRALSPSQR